MKEKRYEITHFLNAEKITLWLEIIWEASRKIAAHWIHWCDDRHHVKLSNETVIPANQIVLIFCFVRMRKETLSIPKHIRQLLSIFISNYIYWYGRNSFALGIVQSIWSRLHSAGYIFQIDSLNYKSNLLVFGLQAKSKIEIGWCIDDIFDFFATPVMKWSIRIMWNLWVIHLDFSCEIKSFRNNLYSSIWQHLSKCYAVFRTIQDSE